ncbi:MAG: carboxypeptidase regulatory-like domain-containing protein [Pseudomonadota bacterium]
MLKWTAGGSLGLALGSATSLVHASDYQAAETPTNGARLHGTLKYSGEPVEPRKMRVVKDTSICGEGFRSAQSLRVNGDGALADGIVQIKGIARGKQWSPDYAEAKMFQIDCTFQPYTQIIPAGANLYVINLDPILHNVHAYEVFGGTKRSVFNFSQPKAGQENWVPLHTRRGHLVMVNCNAHNWMGAWIYMSQSPYLSVTTEDGRFDIPDIPPGKYVLTTWHPVLGERSGEISVGSGDDLNVDLVFT